MGLFIAVVAILLAIIFLIVTHELAHLFTARWLGVKALVFSVGFGRVFYRWQTRRGLQCQLTWFPFGGFVKLLDTRHQTVSEAEKAFAFDQQPFWKKSIILLAGPFTNLCLAIVFFYIVFFVGLKTVAPVINATTPTSIFSERTLAPMPARIVELDGVKTATWLDVMFPIVSAVGNQHTFVLKTQNFYDQKAKVFLSKGQLDHWNLKALSPDFIQHLGLVPAIPEKDDSLLYETQKFSFTEAMKKSFQHSRLLIQLNFIVLGKIITGKLSFSLLAGPLTLFVFAYQSFLESLVAFFYFLGFVSIAVAVINFLPLPGLDGGQWVIALVEALRKKPISIRWELLLYRLSVIFLVVIFIQVLLNDLQRLAAS